MIPRDKLARIAEQLLERSRANLVNWKPGLQGEYFVDFGDARFEVAALSPQEDADVVRVTVHNAANDVVGVAEVDGSSPDWETFRALADDAERVMTGWDKTLERIERSLLVGGKIGNPF